MDDSYIEKDHSSREMDDFCIKMDDFRKDLDHSSIEMDDFCIEMDDFRKDLFRETLRNNRGYNYIHAVRNIKEKITC